MARLRSIRRKVATLSRAGLTRQRLVAEAVLRMLAARIVLVVLPFSRVSRRFGMFVAPTDPRILAQAAALTPAHAATVRQIGWAIRATAPYMPFRSVCLQQAMAGQAMLRRRGIATVLHFGAARGQTKAIEGHAWLDAEGIKVTGYPVATNMTEIACFVHSQGTT